MADEERRESERATGGRIQPFTFQPAAPFAFTPHCSICSMWGPLFLLCSSPALRCASSDLPSPAPHTLHPSLQPLLNFLYRPEHTGSLPPTLRLCKVSGIVCAYCLCTARSVYCLCTAPSTPVACQFCNCCLDSQNSLVSEGCRRRFLHDGISIMATCFCVTAPQHHIHCECCPPAARCQGEGLSGLRSSCRLSAYTLLSSRFPSVCGLLQVADSGTYQGIAPPDTPAAVTVDAVAALLDGATPLHCAALRGNPSQVE